MLVYIAGSGAMGSTIGYHIEKNKLLRVSSEIRLKSFVS